MSKLSVTFIDVGWGDSIFIESVTNNSTHYALIDCNDTTYNRSSLIYVKKYLKKMHVDYESQMHLFDFILLSHPHHDHISGVKQMMSTFGTDWYLYPKSDLHGAFADTLRYANRSNKVSRHQSIDNTKVLPKLGDADLHILWPPHTDGSYPYDQDNPNNNSIVLVLELDRVRFVLTGDCEAQNWHNIDAELLKSKVKMFKFPHHGAENGLFDNSNNTPWLDLLGVRTKLTLSLHLRHGHPHPRVISELNNRQFTFYRTDEHYHVTFSTDGRKLNTKWSRI